MAVHLAEVMTLDALASTNEDFDRLCSFYSEGEGVELMAAIGLFNYFNRSRPAPNESIRPASAEELAQLTDSLPPAVLA